MTMIGINSHYQAEEESMFRFLLLQEIVPDIGMYAYIKAAEMETILN